MQIDIAAQQKHLEQLSIGELRNEYERVFGETNNSRHKTYLIKRILWQLQANAHGGLDEEIICKARNIADMRQLRLTAPSKTSAKTLTRKITKANAELVPGMQLERVYKGQKIVVTAMENGLRWNGELYRSLSAIAKAVTGTHWNGRLFFGLTKKKVAHA